MCGTMSGPVRMDCGAGHSPWGNEDRITDGGQGTGSFWRVAAIHLGDIHLGELGWNSGRRGRTDLGKVWGTKWK